MGNGKYDQHYWHISRIFASFGYFFDARKIENDEARRQEDDTVICKVSKHTSSIIRDILWEEDALGINIKNRYYPPLQADDSISDAAEAITPDTISDADVPIDGDNAVSSSSKESSPEVVFDTQRGAENNFAKYTYWTVETGPHVSYTSHPIFATKREKVVTLLEEAEACMANMMWGEKPGGLRQVPRHILLQAAQVASRAFFDPDYRNYLLNAYET